MKINSSQFNSKLKQKFKVIILYGHDHSYIDFLKTKITKGFEVIDDDEMMFIQNNSFFTHPKCFIVKVNSKIDISLLGAQDIYLMLEYGNINTAERNKLLKNPSVLLISCFSSTGLIDQIKKEYLQNTSISLKTINFLLEAFEGKYGILMQELNKLRHYGRKEIDSDAIKSILYCEKSSNTIKLVQSLLLSNKYIFFIELDKMRIQNIGDIAILRSILEFVHNLYKYVNYTIRPKSPVFFMYQDLFYRLTSRFNKNVLYKIICVLIDLEYKIKMSIGLLDEVYTLISQEV